jgi:hypothetical protein
VLGQPYTDHKPGLFEESLSNKGQLSAWRIAETADLQSIVEHHYRQGPKMLLADLLSRICAPSSGFYDPSLPAKFQALARYLPDSIKKIKTIRLYANKDTAAALSRHVQAWRTPTNPISQGRLGSTKFVDNSNVFFIGVCHAEKSVDKIKELLSSDKQFAVLLPTGLLSEISRGENNLDNETYDSVLEKQFHSLSKIVLSQEGETWLIRVNDQPKLVDVLTAEQVGCDEEEATCILESSLEELITQVTILPDWYEHNREITEERETHVGEPCSPLAARRSSRNKQAKLSAKSSAVTIPDEETKQAEDKPLEETDSLEDDSCDPLTIEATSSSYNKLKLNQSKIGLGIS